MGRLRNRLVGACAALALGLLRLTCRARLFGDVRSELRARGVPYVYCLLHAHQVAAVFANDEARGRLAAMVSRSADGDLLIPGLVLHGVLPVRGSSGSVEKRGREALLELADLLRRRVAVLLAVDGPRGPRNRIQRGVAVLASRVEDAVVLPTLAVPSRRWILRRSWDRMQIPKPFSTVTVVFAPPIEARPGESIDARLHRIAAAMEALEAEHDPQEARPCSVGGAAPEA